jgi:serine phosphatase RsbU (regulator of sigma subunit)
MNLPLEIDLGLDPQVFRIRLQADDLACFYTDGLTEQENEAGVEFGETTVVRTACRFGDRANDLPEALMSRLAAHQGSVPRLDDVTWLQLKVAPLL